MSRFVKSGEQFHLQRSPDTEALNARLDTTGKVLVSDSTASGIKLVPAPLCDVRYFSLTSSDWGTWATSVPGDKPIVDLSTGKVYSAVNGNPNAWAESSTIKLASLITKNLHYFNPITNMLFFAEDVDRVVCICNLGPDVASLAETVAGTLTNKVVNATTAKAAWQQWRTS